MITAVSRVPTTNDPADALAFRAVREACRRHGKDFYFASAFLPRAKRHAAHAVYAFCRMVREAIDVPGEEAGAGAWEMRHRPLGAVQHAPVATGGLPGGSCCSAHPIDERVALFRERLDEIYEGRLELPSPGSRSEAQHALHAFAQAVNRYQVPREHFLDLAEGCRRDHTVSRYATWSSLERQCHAVSSSVALAVSCVFGLTNSGAAEHVLKMGAAIRLTRILCELKADYERGKLYLPLEDLAAYRYGERDVAAGVVNDNFRELMRFEIARARRFFHESAEGLCWVAGDGSRLAAAAVAALSSGVLDSIERHGYDIYSRHAELTPGQKLRRLPLAWRLARRRPGARVPGAFATKFDAPVAGAR
jgi:phytoene synthase